MKRKQKILSSAIMTLLGGTAISFSASAAVIDLKGDATAAKEIATYAKEISTTDLTYKLPPIQINLGGPLSSADAAKNTVAVPPNQTRYARFTLENATIVGTVNPTIAGGSLSSKFTSSVQIAGTSDCPMVSEQGQTSTVVAVGTDALPIADGGLNKTYVTFAIKTAGSTSTDVDNMLSAGCTISVDLQSIKVTNPGQPVKLTYGLFSGPIAAANNTIADTGGMNKQGVTVVQFAPALIFKASTLGKDAVPSVTTQFKLFKTDADNTYKVADGYKYKRATAGAFDFKVDTTSKVLDVNGAEITSVTALLGNTTKLKIDGDFAGIRATGTDSAYFLSRDQACVNRSDSASGSLIDYGTNLSTLLSSVPLSVSFNLTDATNVASGATLFFCLGLGGLNPTPFDSTKTDGVPIIDSNGTFKVSLVPAAQSGYTVSSATEQLKLIKRDGVTLEAPFINIAPGYTSRIMLAHYNKNAADDAKFFIAITGYDGEPQPVQILKDGILKKGTTQKIMSTALFSVPEGAKTHVGVSVNFHASNDDVQGVVQHINSTTGEVTSIPMIRPGGSRGE